MHSLKSLQVTALSVAALFAKHKERAFGALGLLLVASVLALTPLQPLSFIRSPNNTFSIAHAQFANTVTTNNPTGSPLGPLNFTQPGPATTILNNNNGLNGFSASLPTSQSNTQAGQQILDNSQNAAAQQPQAMDQSLGCLSGNFSLCIADIIYFVTVGITSPFAYIGAIFLGAAVKLSLDSTSYAMNFVSSGWTVMRDLANMLFLFVLIYIAFTIMLDASHGGTMQTLAWVIVMALLVNFSFFITRVAIDGSNILAIEIYNAIPASAPPDGSLLQKMGAKDLSASIMDAMDVQGLYDTQNFATYFENHDTMTVLITLSLIFIATAIILVMLAFAFLTAGINFLGRIVVLWFVIIFAPLAFVLRAVPHSVPGDGFYSKWQDALLKNMLFPVAFLSVFLFIVLFMESLADGQGSLSRNLLNTHTIGSATGNGLYNLASIIIAIAIKLGFVILMLNLALEWCNNFSMQSAKAAHGFSKWVGGKYFGAVGWTGRNTAGAGIHALGNSPLAKRFAGTGFFGRNIVGGLNWVGGRSFDARGLRGFGQVADAGKAQSGGYAKDLEERTKRRAEAARRAELSPAQKETEKEKLRADLKAQIEGTEKERGAAERELATAMHDLQQTIGNVKNIEEYGGASPKEIRDARGQQAAAEGHVAGVERNIAGTNARLNELRENVSEKEINRKVNGISHDMATQYAKGMTRLNPENLWGIFNRANKEAYAVVKRHKTEGEKIMEAVWEGEEARERERKGTTSSVTPRPGGASPPGAAAAPTPPPPHP